MKQVPLYAGKGKVKTIVAYAMVDDEDFDRVMAHRWYLMKLYHCKTDIQYGRRYEGKTIDKTYKAILLHRFVMQEFDKKVEVDHINHNGLDNTRVNLKCCTHKENLQNSRSQKDFGSSKYNGVTKYVSSWGCRVKNEYHTFNGEKEAALAYNYISHFRNLNSDKLNDIYQ